MKDFLKLIFGRFSLKPVITPEVYGLAALILALLLSGLTELVYWIMKFFH
jgi:hypothetical protein